MPRDSIRFTVNLVEASSHATGYLAKLSKADLKKILKRYKDFWRLAKEHPTVDLAPAADIDEMWHLHMLFPDNYARDSTRYFGSILDHNPGFGSRAAERAELDRIFNATVRLWEGRFGGSYRLAEGEEPPRCYGFNRGILPRRDEP